jgi:hypothetical protein
VGYPEEMIRQPGDAMCSFGIACLLAVSVLTSLLADGSHAAPSSRVGEIDVETGVILSALRAPAKLLDSYASGYHGTGKILAGLLAPIGAEAH